MSSALYRKPYEKGKKEELHEGLKKAIKGWNKNSCKDRSKAFN